MTKQASKQAALCCALAALRTYMHGTRWRPAGSAHGAADGRPPPTPWRELGPTARPGLHCTARCCLLGVQCRTCRYGVAPRASVRGQCSSLLVVWYGGAVVGQAVRHEQLRACCASCWSISLLLHVYTRAVYVRAERRRCIYTRTTARAYSFTAYRSPYLSLLLATGMRRVRTCTTRLSIESLCERIYYACREVNRACTRGTARRN